MISSKQVAQQLLADQTLLAETVDVDMGYCSCRIQSNSQAFLARLNDYFSFVVKPVAEPTYRIQAIQKEQVDLAVEFIDWKREPGKTGRKDSYVNLLDGRLVRKVRTGVVFLQSAADCIAAGPCLEHDSQVINFITSQMMNHLQQRDWLICHAAAIVHDDKTMAVAGFSGGGKSSLMLAMLEQADTKFLTNDRLFIKAEQGQILAAGIPKMPRINPGTIVHNTRLHALIDEQERVKLLSLSKDALWQLEDKYDADIERFYGLERIRYQAPFQSLLILNWSHDAENEVQLTKVNLREQIELLAAVLKSPGPFYQNLAGQFISDEYQADPEAYLQVLDNVDVYEATGKINFQRLTDLYLTVQS
jgi:HprK-related kinase B